MMNEARKNNVPIDLISRVLSSEADASEKAKLDRWLAKSEKNREIFKQFSMLWEKSGKVNLTPDIDLESEWSHFTYLQVASEYSSKRSGRRLIFTRIAAAASIIILLGFGGFLGYNTLHFESHTSSINISSISLPDGSEVSLYPGSSIKYPKKLNSSKRSVKLDGEAFFNVVRDTQRPFTVSSGDMLVSVLGTSFNVEAFKSEDTFKVIVEEGKVAVSSSKNQDIKEYLLAGEKAAFNKRASSIEKTENDDPNFNAWISNKIIFDNSGMEEIASTLSKVFLKDIINENISEQQKITVVFEDRSLDYILNTIQATLDIEVIRKEDQIIFR